MPSTHILVRVQMFSAELRDFKLQEKRALLISSGSGWTDKESVIVLEHPDVTLRFQNGVSILEHETRGLKLRKNPLSVLKEMLSLGYIGVGYFGYEFFRFLEPSFGRGRQKNGYPLPDVSFLFFDENQFQEKRLKIWQENLQTLSDLGTNYMPRPNMTKIHFCQMVERARQYIAEGDIYQVNLSQRFEVPFKISPELFVAKLYKAQPVPFACCLDFGEFQLISGSMELFLRKNGRLLTTKPIKGTRKRGREEGEDLKLQQELLESEKERAENLMIVDLMRNDLGRVCEFNSVHAENLFKIEPYSTLFQMVSGVSGKLRDGITVEDIIKNTFPPGSVTGAPKRRAMEIIDELEPHLRGPYCGAIGLFMPNGDFTLSVAIRVLTTSDGMGTFWVGGGIMWDSVPESEYEETLIKAQAMMKALG
ncbi:MAG TPA: aminodeoxychorismate synthase component I [Hadesarchaea archaeon]|nr:aminodeoxychorismate synthase component I [Hadesarchaea archaeon]